MAEVVTVPVVGKVKQSWLYAAGALVAGIVGYAWWTRGTVVEDEAVSVELPATEYEPPTVVDSGISVGGKTEGEPIARTNLEWRQMAQEQGEALGFTREVMQSAIAKYIAKGRLTLTEAAAIAAVVGILGQPPTGGPFTISEEPLPTPPAGPTVPGAITGLHVVGRVGPQHMRIGWTAVPGATSYVVQYTGPGGFGPVWPESKTYHDAYHDPGQLVSYHVWARNSAGDGPKAAISFRT